MNHCLISPGYNCVLRNEHGWSWGLNLWNLNSEMNQILKNVKMIEHKPLQTQKVEFFLVIVINNKKEKLCCFK